MKDWFAGGRVLYPLIGLGLLLMFDFFFVPNFFQFEVRDGRLFGTVIDILNQGSKVMLLAIGMTLVIATGGVDLSVGSLMAVAGAVAAVLVTRSDLPVPVVCGVALGAVLLLGAFNGVLVSLVGIQPIVATLILMVAGRGVAMLLTDGQIVTFENEALVYIGNGAFLGLPFTLTLVLAVWGGALLLTRRTALGLFIETVGDNETAARFCGVPNRLVKTGVYCFSAVCAGVAGLIAASNIKAADSSRVGEMMELDAIFAVVVGGTALTGGRFTMAGSVTGALLIQTLTTTMVSLNVSPAIIPVPKAVVIVAVCLLQSDKFRAEIGRVLGRKAMA
ncbi:MAG: ABC transporter permease [Verrucomicrobiae bacterium]|nr:ABC transporter permease [Verrucomicrobiae bacterium]